MSNSIEQSGSSNGGRVLGILLIAIGVVFLAGQVFHINLGAIAWPLFIILPGVGLLALSFAVDETAGEPLAMLGAAVTTVGLILFFQNATGYWASWAYAWALVAPAAFGAGQFLHGAIRGRPDKVRSGLRLAGAGAVVFLIGAVFFEMVIGIGGLGLGRWGWPIVLIAFGLLLIGRSLVSSGRKRTI